MTKGKKEEIDAIWRGTDFERYIICVAHNQNEEANAIREKLFNDGYVEHVLYFEREFGREIARKLQSTEEWEEYIDLVRQEDSGLAWYLDCGEVFWDEIRKLPENRMN